MGSNPNWELKVKQTNAPNMIKAGWAILTISSKPNDMDRPILRAA